MNNGEEGGRFLRAHNLASKSPTPPVSGNLGEGQGEFKRFSEIGGMESPDCHNDPTAPKFKMPGGEFRG